ncbi:MAG: hypothetical protein U1E27_03470 [Kiritimatiellia bacterium]|nr:hypothetical protein [Kiritimatiellia bacterium]
MFEFKPDFDQVLNRFEAWWDCQISDRPLVSIRFPVPEANRIPVPQSNHATHRDRWMDTDYVVRAAVARMSNTVHFADALPVIFPNLGPEVFSAIYGCEMEYGERTAWSRPILRDWSEESVQRLQWDENNFYLRKVLEMTDALIEAGRGRFIVGYTDLHGGGDALAAFRDPQELLLDTLEHPEEIKKLGDRITTDFLRFYDRLYEKLSAAGMPSTTWLPATCRGKFHVPSNDFSCMISMESFQELFLPDIIRECRHMDRCIYHLDGPQALRYLDLLLDIPEIHAIQWVPGAGREDWKNWIEIYQRIQSREKSFVINSVPAEDLPLLFESLSPEGAWIGSVPNLANRAEAETVLKALSRWTRKQ